MITRLARVANLLFQVLGLLANFKLLVCDLVQVSQWSIFAALCLFKQRLLLLGKLIQRLNLGLKLLQGLFFVGNFTRFSRLFLLVAKLLLDLVLPFVQLVHFLLFVQRGGLLLSQQSDQGVEPVFNLQLELPCFGQFVLIQKLGDRLHFDRDQLFF